MESNRPSLEVDHDSAFPSLISTKMDIVNMFFNDLAVQGITPYKTAKRLVFKQRPKEMDRWFRKCRGLHSDLEKAPKELK